MRWSEARRCVETTWLGPKTAVKSSGNAVKNDGNDADYQGYVAEGEVPPKTTGACRKMWGEDGNGMRPIKLSQD